MGMTMLTSDIHRLRKEITHKSSLGNLKSSKLRGKLKLETQYGQDQKHKGPCACQHQLNT